MAKQTKQIDVWDMSNKLARETQVKREFSRAFDKKGPRAELFVELDDYYNNKHYSKDQIVTLAAEKGWDFVPPILPDPFIQVESLIDPNKPDFTFKGRDSDTDSDKAKERQDVVEFILYNNKVDDMMTNNERNLNKLGDAFWKVAYDGSIQGPGYIGEITIGNPDPANIFPLDDSLTDIDDQEMLFYPYRIHRRAARRKWGKIIDTISNDNNQAQTEIYNKAFNYLSPQNFDIDTLQVLEIWYKDDDGDIACTVQINFTEVQYIPKYWINTRASGNKMYPFVKYCKIPVPKSFWDKGEIEAIKDLVDAGDREFLQAILNDMFMSNDIIMEEENIWANGSSPATQPGSRWVFKSGTFAGGKAPRRLGGVSQNANALNMINFIHEKIQETNGNFDSAQGKEPIRVTTSSGIAQLNEKANKRNDIKKADRDNGFRRLYELCDWTALEFYNQDRLVLLRGNQDYNEKNKEAIQAGQVQQKPASFMFNSDNHKQFDSQGYVAKVNEANANGQSITPGVNDQEIAQASYYYPRLDAEIITSNPVQQSKAYTSQATGEILKVMDNINPAKAEVLKSQVETMGLPNQQDITEAIDSEVNMMQQVQSQGQPQQVHPADKLVQALSPEQQKQLLSMPPEQQAEVIKKMMGG